MSIRRPLSRFQHPSIRSSHDVASYPSTDGRPNARTRRNRTHSSFPFRRTNALGRLGLNDACGTRRKRFERVLTTSDERRRSTVDVVAGIVQTLAAIRQRRDEVLAKPRTGTERCGGGTTGNRTRGVVGRRGARGRFGGAASGER